MTKLDLKNITQYVEDNIGTFHQKRIASLNTLRLSKILRRKNPYLFKAKYVLTAQEIINSIVDAHISSNEEAVFGDWLEGLAIYINQQVFNGWKSGIAGIDLEFNRGVQRYIVTIKSGPNWGNSRQIAAMITDFQTASRTLRTSNSQINVVAVNGCCYGRDNNPDKASYFKYCGQSFWEFISGDTDLYTEIIEPLGHTAKEKNEDFQRSYAQVINKITREFSNEFCKPNGEIDWKKLVVFNSASGQSKTQ